MIGRQLGLATTAVLLLGVVTISAPTEVAPVLPGLAARVAEASVAADKKDERKDKKDKQQDDDRGADFVLNGQVLEISPSKNPPEMIVGTVDGRTLVRVLKTDEIARNGVGVGDYVELTGEKINEQLFETTAISVSQRFAGPDSGPGSSPRQEPDPDSGASDDEPE
jgi:hypothetical protein